MAHVFISYSRKDVKIANNLAKQLKADHFDVWIDRSKIASGDDWWDKIVEAIRSCGTFAIILSSNSVKSPMVLRELSVALEFDKPILPLLRPDGELWTPIKHIQCANSIPNLIKRLRETQLVICHHSKDDVFAEKLANGLTALEANVWRSKDPSSIQAMSDSRQIMLLVLSPESMESQAIKEQWQAFDGKGKQIIPLLVRRTAVPSKLRETQPYIDFFNQDYDTAFAQLYGILQTAGVKLREHEKFPIPPQPQLSLSRYDLSKEAKQAIWVSGITLGAFIDALIKDPTIRNPKLDIRLLTLALDVKVANETGAWTGINTVNRAKMDADLDDQKFALLRTEFEDWASKQPEELTDEGHWVAWRLFRNQKKLIQMRKELPNLQVRTVYHRLAMGCSIIDPNQEEFEGILTASPYPYKIDFYRATQPKEPNVAPIFLSNRSPRQSDRWWFDQYVQEFERLWEDATDL